MASPEAYEFGGFTLDVAERRLSRDGAPVHLSPKAHEVLVALVRERGRLVTKDELLARVWPDAFVEEGILSVHVSSLRRALGDANRHPTFIETVPRSGYRFIAAVTSSRSGDETTVREALRPLEVYELVGRGRSHLLSASHFQLPDAQSSFLAAIDLDPSYAPAHAGLALTRCAQASWRMVPRHEAYAAAKTSALRALAMDAACADAQIALGTVLFLCEWDWLGADRSFQRALAINPAHSEALLQYGSLMEALGQLDRGLRLKQQALERDPRSPLVFVQIARSYWHQRRYDEAIAWASRALDLDPRQLLAGEFLAAAYWKQGDIERFIAENLRRAEVWGVAPEALAELKRSGAAMKEAYATGGHAKLNRYMLDQMPPSGDDAASVRRAVLHAALGDLDAAFGHLDRALAARDPGLVHLAVAPQWDGLRADPRLADRLNKMGLPAMTG